jgi:Phage terminase large subunit (GpA)
MVRVLRKHELPLSRWLEHVVRLPGGIAATPGPLGLHPYQRAIADAIADPKVERVSVLKSARVGFTTCLVGAIAHYIVLRARASNEPASSHRFQGRGPAPLWPKAPARTVVNLMLLRARACRAIGACDGLL